MRFVVLQTKLNCPRVSRDFIPRPRLVERLNRGLDRKLILVSAPAGYGKTTLVSAWLAETKFPAAWISLDEGDNDPYIFMSYGLAGIRTLFPDACNETDSLLHSPEMPPISILAAVFSNELSQLGQEFTLVFDDYDCITAADLGEWFALFIERQPANLHLVLITRGDPMLPLARWRARGEMLEIRAADLKFTGQEIGQFLDRMIGATISPETVSILEQSTEGWIVGLRLAGLALRRRSDPTAFVDEFKRASQLDVREYLMDEVLERQSPWVQDFLLRIALLNRFCAALCDHLLHKDFPTPSDVPSVANRYTGSRSVLDILDRMNLFLVPLDEQGEWYRFHPLFAEMLRHRARLRFSPQYLEELNRQASAWFEKSGWIDEALEYALAGGDVETAAGIVEKNFFRSFDLEDRRTACRWLNMLPEAAGRERPALLLARAWELDLHKNYASIPKLLERTSALLEGGDAVKSALPTAVLRGQVAVLWSQHWFFQGKVDLSLEYARQAISLLPVDQLYVRGQALFYLSLCLQLNGHGKEAEDELIEALGNYPGQVNTLTLHILFALCGKQRISAEFSKLSNTARRMLDQTASISVPWMSAWARCFLGFISYEWNDLEAAETNFAAGADLAFLAHPTAVIECLVGLALTYQAQGRIVEAFETVERMATLERALGRDPEEPRSLRARLLLRNGDVETALQWSLGYQGGVDDDSPIFAENSALSQIRIWIAEKKPAGLQMALDRLQRLRKIAETTHNVWRSIEVMALQSLALSAVEEKQLALSVLQQAVILARQSGALRIFVDEGEPMAELLWQLADRSSGKEIIAPEYINRILAAFPSAELPQSPSPLLDKTVARQKIHLSERELQILTLLAQRLSNKEIAARLVLSPGSVKQYTHKLFSKLNVDNRRDAVLRAQSLGLLHKKNSAY